MKATALVLLKAGADLEATDKLGRQALDIAEAGAHSKLADFLKQWAPAQPQVPSSQEAVSPAQPASCPEADSHADGMQTPTGASPPGADLHSLLSHLPHSQNLLAKILFHFWVPYLS